MGDEVQSHRSLVYVVDNFVAGHEYMRATLAERGTEVVCLDGVDAAVQALDECLPDLLLLDLNLAVEPNIDLDTGLGVLRYTRAAGFKGPVIINTAFSNSPGLHERVSEANGGPEQLAIAFKDIGAEPKLETVLDNVIGPRAVPFRRKVGQWAEGSMLRLGALAGAALTVGAVVGAASALLFGVIKPAVWSPDAAPAIVVKAVETEQFAGVPVFAAAGSSEPTSWLPNGQTMVVTCDVLVDGVADGSSFLLLRVEEPDIYRGSFVRPGSVVLPSGESLGEDDLPACQ